jgi:hypothetical protein
MIEDPYVVLASISIHGNVRQLIGNVKCNKHSCKLFQFGFLTLWHSLRRALRETRVLRNLDDDISKDFMQSPHLTATAHGHAWMVVCVCWRRAGGPTHADAPLTTNFNGVTSSLTHNQRKAAVHGPHPDGRKPKDWKDWWQIQP